ncbi:putative nucleotidyltransferase with HDIG domain [Sphaerotilus hippei]|uniref:Putative nucleotidyltransferase with HDIG domain n=1 Tax=Sphaerotilus hippei TaxID=744406 RepID=A0A318H415_9BURK|nr:HD-GYP domain-containing protein [Sphaerotilus hippei]PXW98543.1 putative nucleotidyltransferase with HDIG domain [Sphaerotilus hippei]
MIFDRADDNILLIDTESLRLGMFVHLELGWLDHPFSRSRFRLDHTDQIGTLRQLGLKQVKVRRDLSDPAAFAVVPPAAAAPEPVVTPADTAPTVTPESTRPAVATQDPERARRRALLSAQRLSLQRCERAHAVASSAWLGVTREVVRDPATAHETAQALAGELVEDMMHDEHTTLRVLGEAAGTAASQHAINVAVLALMLARFIGLPEAQLNSVALGALMHDIGKHLLPEHLRNVSPDQTTMVLRERREHVAQGVRLGMAMGMDPVALRILAQHHELQDGSGLPQGLKGDEIALPARVVALVDQYDRLCNPRQGSIGRTPHEAQALLFAQMRGKLDHSVLAGFVKLMGVYPPGSVVELSDGRHALVTGVQPAHPLKPSVVVHDPKVDRDVALLLHLKDHATLSIRRSLHPQHLPRATLDYLSPRDRVHYYFAHGGEAAAAIAA